MRNIEKKELAPIALFVYNRLSHVQKVIDALKKCDLASESIIYIFSDGPRLGDVDNVDNVRRYLAEIEGFQKIEIINRKENWGVEKSIIEGISYVMNLHKCAIILEDDTVVSKGFLKYMNKALCLYENTKQVFYISGYSYLRKPVVDLPQCMFFRMPSTWGWATWNDRWEKFHNNNFDVENILKNKTVLKKFTFDYANTDWAITLCSQYREQEYTWDVWWHVITFINDGLVLVPNKSLVSNIGMDGSGVHHKGGNPYEVGGFDDQHKITKFPLKICEDRHYKRRIVKILKKQRNAKILGLLYLWRYVRSGVKS